MACRQVAPALRYLAGSPFTIYTRPISQGCLSEGLETELIEKQPSITLRVAFAGVNRLDLLQRAGRYPVPSGSSDILGVEVSGWVEEVHDFPSASETQLGLDKNVNPFFGNFHRGARILALIQGGGYANRVRIPASLCLPVPRNLSLLEAAAIPEAWITAFQLCRLADVQPTDTVLIHAAASGVGTALTQLVKAKGCSTVIGVCSSDVKKDYLKQLGCTTVLDRRNDWENLKDEVLRTTEKGVNVIFDCVGGGPSFSWHCSIAALDARWVLFGTLGGLKVVTPISLGPFLSRRLSLLSTTLRSRSLAYRSELVQRFGEAVLPKLGDKKFQIYVQSLPWTEAEQAHALLEKNENLGKVVLEVEGEAASL